MKSSRILELLAVLVTVLVLPTLSLGKENSTGRSRTKVIDFEDDIVEGLNKKPLDSLNQISEKDRKRKKPHLYRKRVGFKTEVQETLNELRYVQ